MNILGVIFFIVLFGGILLDFAENGFWATLIKYLVVFLIIAFIIGFDNLNQPGSEKPFIIAVVVIQVFRIIRYFMSIGSD